jgi:hypothetical protein
MQSDSARLVLKSPGLAGVVTAPSARGLFWAARPNHAGPLMVPWPAQRRDVAPLTPSRRAAAVGVRPSCASAARKRAGRIIGLNGGIRRCPAGPVSRCTRRAGRQAARCLAIALCRAGRCRSHFAAFLSDLGGLLSSVTSTTIEATSSPKLSAISSPWNLAILDRIVEQPRAANSGPRWSMIGGVHRPQDGSGRGVGPGICRKWRPATRETFLGISVSSAVGPQYTKARARK